LYGSKGALSEMIKESPKNRRFKKNEKIMEKGETKA
jgi:hypothetical protein